MRKIISILLLILINFSLTGCIINKENPYPYNGSYKELYTTAIYSIPNAVGYMNHGEGAYNSDIYIWEQDDYGRTLFSYCEDYGNKVFALVIMQSYDDTNAYFYPDINYRLTYIDSEYYYEGVDEDYLMNKTKDFYLENKDQLKSINDWNQPLDKSKCVSYLITDYKMLDKNIIKLDENQCNEILNEYTKTLNFVNPDDNSYRYSSILQSDSTGKVLYEICGLHTNYDKSEKNDWGIYEGEYTYYYIILWIITDKDGNYDKDTGIKVMFSKSNEIDNTFIYDEKEILEFKNINGWKNLYCSK